ncbi:hypothetical protein JCM19053_1476 [Vibrio sp. JCM 19053]|nr:hypothetical protein JCM19053_1476 [Vibrio sp. JCM 19053]
MLRGKQPHGSFIPRPCRGDDDLGADGAQVTSFSLMIQAFTLSKMVLILILSI